MKLFTGLILCSLVLGAHGLLSFLGEAFEGAKDMWRAYSDMREANYKGADKYFHARGNYDAAQRGPGGAWAAKVIRRIEQDRHHRCTLDLRPLFPLTPKPGEIPTAEFQLEKGHSTMKLFIGVLFCTLIMGVTGEGWYSFFKEAVQGASDLWRAYWDMREANYQNSGRYFRARGNYEAAQRGPGGVWAAKIISNVGEYLQGFLHQIYLGRDSIGLEDQVSNRRAEEWGRSGQDPDHFRPEGLPKKY
ncbi:serum amyloid A-4 protein isoform X1 [Odocoileus virginianus]|uniref:Serum amyloid A-4 protein isoform X1 n=3 Tax=Odocoileus virginianus TaxID=9874 RepID=A0A6J0YNF5_ODOVR